MSVTDFTKPFYLSDTEQALARSALDAIVHSGTIHLEPDGSLPDTVKNFVDILNALAEGQSITVISRILTTVMFWLRRPFQIVFYCHTKSERFSGRRLDTL